MKMQTQNSIPVSCIKCENVFRLSDFETEMINTNQYTNIEHIYFTCPSCNHLYTCYYTDILIRAQQRSIQQLYEHQATNPTATRAKQLVSLQQQLKHDMTALRQAIEASTEVDEQHMND